MTNPPADPARITALLQRARAGDRSAEADLVPEVYDELRRLARAQIEREASGHTLQVTALVHEAYLRLFGGTVPEVRDRAHFLALAARAMRHVLVDHARQRRAKKRGAGAVREPLDEAVAALEAGRLDLIALHDALEQLGERDPELVQVVELHFFAGFSLREVAGTLGLAERTVHARWSLARAWLRGRLGAD